MVLHCPAVDLPRPCARAWRGKYMSLNQRCRGRVFERAAVNGRKSGIMGYEWYWYSQGASFCSSGFGGSVEERRRLSRGRVLLVLRPELVCVVGGYVYAGY